jgi:hypothetical protein
MAQSRRCSLGESFAEQLAGARPGQWHGSVESGLDCDDNRSAEAGQVQSLFVALLLGVRAILARLPENIPGWAHSVPPYAIGTIAVFWVIERIGAFWS